MLDSVRQDLIVSLDGIEIDRVLEFWRWLIPETDRPLFATAMGDLFLEAPGGSIHWLDMGGGELQTVAASEEEFQIAVTDEEKSSFWFGAVLIDRLREVGKVLRTGECYSYCQLPILGGTYEPENFRIYDITHHFRVWGPIREQLRDLPDGTTFEFEFVE
ncbi:MAG TPA: T6SS immunity protein Tdi1 domain-containing protein [Schlesneria sp.]